MSFSHMCIQSRRRRDTQTYDLIGYGSKYVRVSLLGTFLVEIINFCTIITYCSCNIVEYIRKRTSIIIHNDVTLPAEIKSGDESYLDLQFLCNIHANNGLFFASIFGKIRTPAEIFRPGGITIDPSLKIRVGEFRIFSGSLTPTHKNPMKKQFQFSIDSSLCRFTQNAVVCRMTIESADNIIAGCVQREMSDTS